MASVLKTSEVYVEEIYKFPVSIKKVATAIPAFIGYTQIAHKNLTDDLIDVPIRISSLLEYTTYFGNAELETNFSVFINEEEVGETTIEIHEPSALHKSKYLMYYAIQMYFANGGGPCYIISVGTYKVGGTPDIENLKSGLDILTKEDEPTLIVFPDATSLPDATTFYNLYNDALVQCADLQDRFTLIDTYSDDYEIEMNDSDDQNTNYGVRHRISAVEEERKYGAVYFPYLKTLLNYQLDESRVLVNHILVPNETVSTSALSGKFDSMTLKELEDLDIETYNLIKKEINTIKVVLPPSSSMAGIYAKVDNSRGVWRSPENVFLNYVDKPTVKISNRVQRELSIDCSGKSINAIRYFRGKGVVVQGARTLLSNDNDWQYVPTRRFFNMIHESIKKALMQFNSEPNDANTWAEVRVMVETFLINQWESGALVGATPSEAFYVSIGLNQTMTIQEIFNRTMNIEIGMAVESPSTFTVLKFSQEME